MHYRGGDVVETERFVASLTVKMGMQVVDLAGATGAADCIFERACPVVNAVHKMVGQEKGDGAENGRFIHRIQYLFQIEQRDGTSCFQHGLQHQDTYGGGLYLSFK